MAIADNLDGARGRCRAQPPSTVSPQPGWLFDELTLTNGAKFQGVLLDDGPREVKFQTVQRRPGRPTFTLTWKVPRSDVAAIKKLADADRAILKARVAELDQDGSGERRRIQAPRTGCRHVARRTGQGKTVPIRMLHTGFRRSRGSDSPRRGAAGANLHGIRPVPAADSRRGAAHHDPAGPGQRFVQIAARPARAHRFAQSGRVRSPRQPDRLRQRYTRLGKELEDAKFHHAQQIADLDRYESSLRKLYKEPELNRYLDPVRRNRRMVYRTDRENGAKFDKAASRLFAVLYHEAFHAYAATFVFPPLTAEQVMTGKGTGALPRWLNEGLAAAIRAAVVEAGEVRAEYADPVRLEAVKNAIRGKNGLRLVPLAELLTVGKESFLAKHADQSAAADRAYLTSWAAAYYLTFERRVLAPPSFAPILPPSIRAAIPSSIRDAGRPTARRLRTRVARLPAETAAGWNAVQITGEPSGLSRRVSSVRGINHAARRSRWRR